jgi:hypothetical protein
MWRPHKMVKNQGKGKIWKMFYLTLQKTQNIGKLGFFYVRAFAHADAVELL